MERYLRKLAVMSTLLAVVGLAQAQGDEDLCAEFKDGVVDETLLSVMLSAAKGGHLYRIQPNSSRVGFCVESALKRIEGSFQDFKGGITLDPGANSNGQTMVLIHADSLETEGKLIRNLLMGENFFDTEQHPEILFVSHSFTWTGSDTAVLKGDLTLRGITHPVIFDVSLTETDQAHPGRILVNATTRINRDEFGMDKLKALADSEVQLCINAQAEKYRQTYAAGPPG